MRPNVAKLALKPLLTAHVAALRKAGFPDDWIEATPVVQQARAALREPAPPMPGRPHLTQADQAADDAIGAFLQARRERAFSGRAVAQAIACSPEVRAHSQSLQNYTLPRLRRMAGTRAHRCYCAETGRFRWMPPNAK